MPFAREDLDSNYFQSAMLLPWQSSRADLGQHVIARGRHFGGEVKPAASRSGGWAGVDLRPGKAIEDLIDQFGSCSTIGDAVAGGGEGGDARREVRLLARLRDNKQGRKASVQSRMLSRPP